MNEIYPRLVVVKEVGLNERTKFYGLCTEKRRILVDAARSRGAHKRGRRMAKVNIDKEPVLGPQLDASVLALNDASEDFAKIALRQARVLELRWFAGLIEHEVAQFPGTTERTVRRHWTFAKGVADEGDFKANLMRFQV